MEVPRQRSEGPRPHTELPSLEHWCREEEPRQHLAVKTSRDSDPPVGPTATGNTDVFLKGPCTDSGAGRRSPWALVGR